MSLLYDFIIQFSIIISILLFLFSKGYFLIKKFKYLKFLNLSPIIGYSILIVEINFLYFGFKLNSIATFYLIFGTSSFFLVFSLYNYRLKFFKDFFSTCLIFLPIILFLLILSSFYGEQYYVFRGNAWDYFGYVTSGHLSSDYSFDEIQALKESNSNINTNMYYLRAISWFNTFPVFSSVLGVFLNALNLNIFLEFYLFKVVTYSLYSLGAFVFFNNLFKFSYIENYIITQTLIFNFYNIYILEIDSLRQISTLGIFIVCLLLLNIIFLNKKFQYFTILLLSTFISVLYLIYNELLIIFFLIFIIFIIFNKNYLKLIRYNNIKFISFGLLCIFVFSFPSILIMFDVLISQLKLGMSLKPMWYVYFGSFFLGRITPDLFDQEFVSHLSLVLSSDLNFLDFFIKIFNALNNFNYGYVYANLIPSSFGFYYLTDINFVSDIIYTPVLYLFGFYLIYNYLKNLKYLFMCKKNKYNILKSLIIIFIILFTLFLIQGKIFSIIKLILYFSLIIFIPTFINLQSEKIKLYLSILVFIFPIYKFSVFNDGITRQDSFPSIQIYETKKNYNWNFNLNNYLNCSKIILNIKDNINSNQYHSNENVLNYFKYLHLVVNLLNNNYKFDNNYEILINSNNLNKKKVCQIDEEKIY